MQINETLIDTAFLYAFLRRLATPFRNWKAYELGVIDDKGNILVDKNRRNVSQKNSFTPFDVVVRNLKRLLEKLPGGNSVIASYAAALYLMKEEKNALAYQEEDVLYESFQDFYDILTEDKNNMKKLRYLIEQTENSGAIDDPDTQHNLDEDGAPANSVAGGGVAGLTVATGGPVIHQNPKKKKKLESFKNRIAK